MENSYDHGPSASFRFGRIVGDPFALATISIGLLAWIIAFVSSILSAIHGGFPNFAWWTLVFMLFCIIGVTVTVASDAERTYHVAVRWPRHLHHARHTRHPTLPAPADPPL